MHNPNHYAGTRNFIIGTTRTQRTQLRQVFADLEPDGAVIAQVFHDGIRCKCITPDQARKIAELLGGEGFRVSIHKKLSTDEGSSHDK